MTNIFSTYVVTLGSKADPITVELDMSNQAAIHYLIEYGLKQSLNDSIAAVKVTDTDYTREGCRALAEKRLAAILAGTVKQAGTREASDPVGVEAKKLARAALVANDQARKAAMTAWRKAGGTGTDAEVMSGIVAQMAGTPRWREAAEAVITARKAATPEINLAEFGL